MRKISFLTILLAILAACTGQPATDCAYCGGKPVKGLEVVAASATAGSLTFRSVCFVNKGAGVFSSTTVQRHQFFGAPPSLRSSLTTVHAHWEDHSLDCMDLCRQSNVSDSQHTV